MLTIEGLLSNKQRTHQYDHVATAIDGYKCPYCENDNNNDEKYIVNNMEYPIIYNESKGFNGDCNYWNWEELHICQKCGSQYKISNGAY